MRFYNFLFMGEKAQQNSEKIIENIKKGKMQWDKYVLTLPQNESDVLDIYPSYILRQKYYRKSDLIVVGIADGKKEAEKVMQDIIMECYLETGGFKLKDYVMAAGVSA